MASGFKRRPTKPVLGKPYGKPTARPRVLKPKVVGQAILRARRIPAVHSKLAKPYGGVLPKGRPRATLKGVDQAVLRARRIPPTHSKLGKRFGRPTTRPPARKLQVLDQAIMRARRIAPVHSAIGKPRGRPTARAPVRPPRVLLQAVNRAVIQRRIVTHSVLRRAPRATAPIQPPHVRAMTIVRQAVSRRLLATRIQTRSILAKPGGKPTKRTIVRPLRVVGQAVQRGTMRPRLITHSKPILPHGGIIAPGPPPSSSNYHTWYAKVGIKTKISVNSQVDGESGDIP